MAGGVARGRRCSTDVAAIAVGGQQHGMVCLDEAGAVVRDALLWNDTRSADAATDLIGELPGGAQGWADAVGTVPVASITVTKLRWLADHEPDNAARTAAVCLPHDWLTWRLRGTRRRRAISSPTAATRAARATGRRRPANTATTCCELAFRRAPRTAPRARRRPRRPARRRTGSCSARAPATTPPPRSASPRRPGDVIVSIGTSGVVSAISSHADGRPVRDRRRLRRRDRALPAAGLHAQRRAGARLDGAAARGVARRAVRPRAVGARRAPTASCSSRISTASAPRTGPTPPRRCSGCGTRTRRRRTSRGPRSRACCAGWPTASTRCASRASRSSGCCSSAAVRARRRCAASRRRSSRRRSSCRRPASTSPTAPRARRPGCCRVRPKPPTWEQGAAERYEADPVPAVRARYAEVRDLTASRG